MKNKDDKPGTEGHQGGKPPVPSYRPNPGNKDLVPGVTFLP